MPNIADAPAYRGGHKFEAHRNGTIVARRYGSDHEYSVIHVSADAAPAVLSALQHAYDLGARDNRAAIRSALGVDTE